MGSNYMAPSGLNSWIPCAGTERDLCSAQCCNLWWARDDAWGHYVATANATDWPLFSTNFAGHPNATVIVNFPAFAADPSWGGALTARLDTLLGDISRAKLNAMLLISRPEIQYSVRSGTGTHDVVHNATARQYLLARMGDIGALPAVRATVRLVSVSWMGASNYCGGSPAKCSGSDISTYAQSLQAAVHSAAFAPGSRYVQHVDGPWWDGCKTSPCPDWSVAGYSPGSLSGLDGVLAESWVQGSLVRGVAQLFSTGAFSPTNTLLMCDVPDCDLDGGSHPCSTGSLEGDETAWFSTLQKVGLDGTWAVWQFVDGGLRDGNDYGDVTNDGTALTRKGQLHAARAKMAMAAAAGA